MHKLRAPLKQNLRSICRTASVTLMLAVAGCASTGTPDRKASRPSAGGEPAIATAAPNGSEMRTGLKPVISSPPGSPTGVAKAVTPNNHEQGIQHDAVTDTDESSSESHLLPQSERPGDERYPIDLTAALQLAGANNIQIALAAERICEAQARLESAESLWIPSLVGGTSYNRHDGTIQNSDGTILSAGRSGLFVGGGPALGSTALAGQSTGAARLGVDLSLSDVIFRPLAERQSVRAAQANQSTAFNDTLLQVALSYEELLRAQTRVAVVKEIVQNAEKLADVTEKFSRTGVGLEADALRARAELADRRRESLVAEEQVRVVSTELARLLRLDSGVTLTVVDAQPAPLDLIDLETPLPGLIALGLTQRPELARHQAEVAETVERLRQEEWRPMIPTLYAGYSSGGMGGGVNSSFGSFGGRGDFDVMAVWELKNLGFGNRGLRRQRGSQYRQAQLQLEQICDQIAAEVARTFHQSRFRRQQIEAAESEVKLAVESLELNFKGIYGGAGLRPIEAQQAFLALAAARNHYAGAIIDYNQAQFQLLRALGRLPDSVNGTSGLK